MVARQARNPAVQSRTGRPMSVRASRLPVALRMCRFVFQPRMRPPRTYRLPMTTSEQVSAASMRGMSEGLWEKSASISKMTSGLMVASA